LARRKVKLGVDVPGAVIDPEVGDSLANALVVAGVRTTAFTARDWTQRVDLRGPAGVCISNHKA